MIRSSKRGDRECQTHGCLVHLTAGVVQNKMQSIGKCGTLAVLGVLAIADIIAIGVYFARQQSSGDSSYDVLSPLPPSNSTLGVYNKAAVVSHGGPCAGFGREMLAAGGSVVDAAIATLLCEGVCVMYSMGVGGGFFMTLYNKTENKTYSLVARETAPAAATRDMFVNNWTLSTFGPLSIAVPGELKGYQEAHERFGKLPWKQLFEPTIRLCEEGVPINKRFAEMLEEFETEITSQPSFVASILNTTDGRIPKEGDFLKLPKLAQTLRIIADSPLKAGELYNGSLTKDFVADIQKAGGIISEEDMHNYRVRWEDPVTARLSDDMTVYSAALPGSGILVNFILKLMDGFLQFAYSNNQRSQLIIEAFKHTFGRRTDLGDPYFLNKTTLDKIVRELTDPQSILNTRRKIRPGWTTNNVTYYGAHYLPDDHGTNNIVVLGPDGSAVSVTSSLNHIFGSKFVSTSTGIVLNNQMDDFSTPGQTNYFGLLPSESNFIVPGKMPLSSMSPTVVVDRWGDVRLVVGAAGGTTITSQVAMIIMKNLWLGKNIKEAIDEPRYHHQLMPMNISYEYGILEDEVESWRAIGHCTERISRSNHIAVVSAIARLGQNLTANCDIRRPGSVDGL